VGVLLRASAVVSLTWAVLLLAGKARVFPAGELSPLVAALANGLGSAHLVFAGMFWYAARQPAAHRGIIYGAILLQALKMSNDVYEMLALLPPESAMVSLGDLVVSIGLLVGLLEALPRTFGVARSA